MCIAPQACPPTSCHGPGSKCRARLGRRPGAPACGRGGRATRVEHPVMSTRCSSGGGGSNSSMHWQQQQQRAVAAACSGSRCASSSSEPPGSIPRPRSRSSYPPGVRQSGKLPCRSLRKRASTRKICHTPGRRCHGLHTHGRAVVVVVGGGGGGGCGCVCVCVCGGCVCGGVGVGVCGVGGGWWGGGGGGGMSACILAAHVIAASLCNKNTHLK